jgi:cation:H+ antiporter
MVIPLLKTTVGLLFLLGGGEVLLRGAAGLAARLGLSPLLIGLTVVAAATSMPELVVVVTSGIQGVPDLGVGNVIGSNIANILLILGVAAVLWPIATRPEHVLRDGLVLLGATLMFTVFALIGGVGRIDGAVMLVALMAYLVFSYLSDRRINGAVRNETPSPATAEAAGPEAGSPEVANPDTPGDAGALPDPRGLAESPARARLATALVFVVTGVGALIGGSQLLVDGAVVIAQRLGVSDAVIGLTLVAVGTSLPELATAIVAGMRRHSEIALGNVLGSNVFNLLLILGLLALITPFHLAQEMLDLDLWVMIGAVVVLLPVMMTGWRIGRREGAVFLVLYGIYVAMKYEPAVIAGAHAH